MVAGSYYSLNGTACTNIIHASFSCKYIYVVYILADRLNVSMCIIQ